MFNFTPSAWFKSSQDPSHSTWDANTVTMDQPTSPSAPTTENVVTEQPVQNFDNILLNTLTTNCMQARQEQMKMDLRGGAGAGDICCGV
ncbi:hypothetical protein PHISCL_09107 [Aspergillus sclerotialis]|uniref:Uncharacterized protein n=1 Tax=Aspergillus sclerotialis TaxID=2070753 RepID=A0A3A2ZN98_9EURO|nr:hypothetical protein PHISCL_09107 [Aspergillus sclerotialis]